MMTQLTRSRRWPVAYPGGGLPVTSGAPVDVEETEDGFRVEVELPGVAPGDVQIEVRDYEVRVSGAFPQRHRDGTVRHRARRSGAFEYLVALPVDVDADRAGAELDRGVLVILAPKVHAAVTQRIAVRTPARKDTANPAAKAAQLRDAAPAMGGTGQVGRSAGG